MDLQLIFEGEAPLAPNLLADILRRLDRRFFVHEKQAIRALGRSLPPEVWQGTPGQRRLLQQYLSAWTRELSRQYETGEFSMVYVTSVHEGSVVVQMVVGGNVPQIITSALPGIVVGVLGVGRAAGAVLARDVLKEQPLYKALLNAINRGLQPELQERAIKSLMDVAKQLGQPSPPTVEEVVEEPPRERRRKLELGPPYDEEKYERVYSVKDDRFYEVLHEPFALPQAESTSEEQTSKNVPREVFDIEPVKIALPRKEPEISIPEPPFTLPDRTEIESITARHRPGKPVRIEARIKRISVKPPPLIYRSE